MKQYVIDELRASDYEKIKTYMDANFTSDVVPGIYWIPIPDDQLSEAQAGHAECHPFFFAVEMGPQLMACELLIRTRSRLRCSCIRYATEGQRNWLIDTVDAIFERLEIIS